MTLSEFSSRMVCSNRYESTSNNLMTISSRLNYNLMIFAAHIFGLNSSFHLSFPLDVFLNSNQILPLSTEQLELSKQSQSVSSHKAGFLCCPSLQLLQF